MTRIRPKKVGKKQKEKWPIEEEDLPHEISLQREIERERKDCIHAHT